MTEQPGRPDQGTDAEDDAARQGGSGDGQAAPAADIPVTPPATSLAPETPATDYTATGVPTLGYLQDKIDRRYGTALGATELAEAGREAQAAQQAAADRERTARDRLDELRRSLDADDH